MSNNNNNNNNLVLYRKYRPKVFADVIGQEHIIRTITNAIAQNITSHGYLFSGPHGTGKTTIARLLAKSLNCQNRKQAEFEPCNKCQSCLEVNQGNALDLIEIDAASNRGIDEIRELKEGIMFRPAKSKYKVFIIDESHQLTKEAANALLKTLEEPPAHAVFILATTEIHKMIPTIQSRCQTFTLRKLAVLEIVKRLEKILKAEKVSFEKQALDLIALSAGGAVRDAESLLDEVVSFTGQGEKIIKETVQVLLGSADKAVIFKFLNFLVNKQTKEAIELINTVIYQGVDLAEFIKTLIEYLRQIMLLKINSQLQSPIFAILSNEEQEALRAFTSQFQEVELSQILEKFTEAENKMKYATILQLPLELAIIDICQKTQ